MTNKSQTVETAMINNKTEDNRLRIKITEPHSKKYLEKLKETTYKDKEVVFILPSGKEV